MKFNRLSILIVFVLTACGANPSELMVPTAKIATQNVKPTATRMPTRVLPTSTPEPPACYDTISINNDWTTIFCDNFDDNRNDWESNDASDLANSLYKIENGELVVDFSGINTSGYQSGVVQRRGVTIAKDFVFSLNGEIISNFENNAWGVVFREADGNYFLFMVTNNGGYWLDRYKDGKWDSLITFRKNNAIKYDDVNNLVVVAEDDAFTFYVNDKIVNSYESSSLSGDGVYLSVWTAEGVKARFEFDDLVVKEKP